MTLKSKEELLAEEFSADEDEAGSNGNAPATKKQYERDDVGNGERFVDRFGKAVRYVPKWRTWLSYDGVKWARVSTGFMNELAKDVVEDMRIEANAAKGDTKDERVHKDELFTWARATSMGDKTEVMVKQARGRVEAQPEDFDKDPWLVNALDVTIDLHTGLAHKHDPADMLTKVTGVAYSTPTDGARFLKFIDEVTGGDKELARYIQKVLGYSLSGVIREHHLFIPYGTGRNGKTVLFEAISAVMGDYATVGDTTLLIDQGKFHPKNFSLANMVGARMVVFSEINENDRLNTKQVKELTGGDSQNAEAKFQQAYKFQPQFKMFLYLNHLPTVEEVGDALWERIRIIPFNQCFIKDRPDCYTPDLDMKDKLIAKGPFILQWLVEGALLWQKEGIDPPQSVLEATTVYQEDSDALSEFVKEAINRNPKGKVKGPLLYDIYNAWFEGDYTDSLTKIEFGKRIGKQFPGRRSHGATTNSGLELKEGFTTVKMIQDRKYARLEAEKQERSAQGLPNYGLVTGRPLDAPAGEWNDVDED